MRDPIHGQSELDGRLWIAEPERVRIYEPEDDGPGEPSAKRTPG